MMPPTDVSQRIKELEELYIGGVVNSESTSVSIETLLDILLVLYDECQGSTLCRERNISGFVTYGLLRLRGLLTSALLSYSNHGLTVISIH